MHTTHIANALPSSRIDRKHTPQCSTLVLQPGARVVQRLFVAAAVVLGITISFGGSIVSAQTRPLKVCSSGALAPDATIPANVPDLVVTSATSGQCTVNANGSYYYRNINILSGATLWFKDSDSKGNPLPKIDFWAESILVQNGGKLLAGTNADGSVVIPFGSKGQVLTIHLWGIQRPPHGAAQSISCLLAQNTGNKLTYVADPKCGVPDDPDPAKGGKIWSSNPTMMDMAHVHPASCQTVSAVTGGKLLPGGVDDCFYAYQNLDYDLGYFGYKVVAVSYGGTLQMYGYKGASVSAAVDADPSNSGISWVRLAADLKGADKSGATNPQDKTVVLDRAVSWVAGDQIVITPTDYVPTHAELLTIQSVSSDGKTLTISDSTPVYWPHSGTAFSLSDKIKDSTAGPDVYCKPGGTCAEGDIPKETAIETRAAVGLLSRSIRIVSEGDTAGTSFPKLPSTYSFGGHTIARQGFLKFQMQGVEFYQLGQGGRIMHYPVHFHMARKTPPNTFVKDSSSWDSMTRWYTIHATQGVTLARNVGYLSIGHGYYLEDGTETDNKLYANLGVLARAAVANSVNPRQVPGIFSAEPAFIAGDKVPFNTDAEHPTDFWITNGWNDFRFNMAAGAETCGVCYWLVPSAISGGSRFEAWQSYASEQKGFKKQVLVCTNGTPPDTSKNPPTGCSDGKAPTEHTVDDLPYAGSTPLMNFVGNSCSTAMNSFITVGQTSPCSGVDPGTPSPSFTLIANKDANSTFPPPTLPNQDQPVGPGADNYFPKMDPGGSRAATACGATGDCNPTTNNGANGTLQKCAAGQEDKCMVTVIDHYTSSFNWANTNVSAIWLRPQWYLFSNSALTDVQNGGLTMITGGDYTESSVIPGYWGLSHNDVFVGETRSDNPYASAAGPFTPTTKALTNPVTKQADFVCEGNGAGDHCLLQYAGLTMPRVGFAVNQRLFNIYDGPAYQAENAYLNIQPTTLDGCTPHPDQTLGADCTHDVGWMYGMQQGILKTSDGQKCYMPNAAIAWKQPNGFFYPPAFHSENLFFGDDVKIRHFVIEPLFRPTSYVDPFHTNLADIQKRYCSYASDMFAGQWSDVDRQTELTDDDGTLTGLVSKQSDLDGKAIDEVVSVNLDPFFAAPVEDAECASDIDVQKNSTASGTANVSPYEYVSTVIYPDCKDSCKQPPSADIVWSKDCNNVTCFGAPIYREQLTGTEDGDRTTLGFPSILAMGTSLGQRNTLTVNHGHYYIDTTVPVADQQSHGFTHWTTYVAGQTYYTFLLYARPDTVQTYDVYIGPGLDENTVETTDTYAFMVRIPILNAPFVPDGGPGTWPSDWSRKYNRDTGILTVTMNMKSFKSELENAKAAQCSPASYCKSDTTTTPATCGCALPPPAAGKIDTAYNECSNTCKNWAGKDLDCPDHKCYGFGFKLADNFANTTHIVPTPGCFSPDPDPDQNNFSWATGFDHGKTYTGDTCAYTTLPTGNFAQTCSQTTAVFPTQQGTD